jgi:hypothetical protein
MSTTNNTTATNTNDDISFMKMFNRGGLKDLVVAHQHAVNYIGTVAHIYNPMIYTLPKEVAKPTTAEKATLARMLRREKEIMGKIKRLIEGAEKECDELLAELGFGDTGETTGWNTGWGTAANLPQADENDDGADDNTEAN